MIQRWLKPMLLWKQPQRTSLVNGKLRDQLVMFGFSLWLFEINTTLNKPSAIGPFRVVKWKSCMSFLCRECSLPIHQMGGTLSKTKKVDFLNGPSYWKWCVWDGQCFGSFEVSLPVKNKSNFGMILARYQLTCPHPLWNSELDLPLPLFQDGAKRTQAKAAVEAAQEDGFCWVKTAGWH